MFEVGQPVKLRPGATLPVPTTANIRVPLMLTVRQVDFAGAQAKVKVHCRGLLEEVVSDWIPFDDFLTDDDKPQEREQWTNEKLGALCREWQGRLRLQDWTITVLLVRAHEMALDNALAEVYAWNSHKRKAIIHVLDPQDTPKGERVYGDRDPERDMVHEMVHLHLKVLSDTQEFESVERSVLEQGIEAITDALIDLKREGEAK